jgi:hypothetical protein
VRRLSLAGNKNWINTPMTAILPVVLSILLLFHSNGTNPQEDQLQIRLYKNWGYSSGTGKIQGTFTIISDGTDDVSRVIFYIDDQVLGEVNEEPFDFQFKTDPFPLGPHRLYAIGYTDEGNELTSNILQVDFVSSDEGWQAAMNIILPIVVLILGAVTLAFLVPFVFARGKKEQLAPGAPRNYGYYGGAICPKCNRPFSRHIYGLNLGPHKFDRCPYCGKWSLVKRASREELEIAEAAEIIAAQEGIFVPGTSEEEELRREIEDSRFEDL